MTEFSDRPFVAGSLVGLRAFSVDSLGRLTGPRFGGVFKPGENVASCGGDRVLTAALQRRINALTIHHGPRGYTVVGGQVDVPGAAPEPRPHVIGGTDCTCGFYAYFDGSNSYAKADRVTAVIEGYGVCTVGSAGFRAEKARLLAIVDPAARPWWRPAWWKFEALTAVGCVGVAVGALAVRDWVTVAIQIGLALVNGALAVWDWKRHRAAVRRLDFVRRNYPDVPRLPTVRAALRAHPLTPPDPIDPSTAEDFWTRSA